MVHRTNSESSGDDESLPKTNATTVPLILVLALAVITVAIPSPPPPMIVTLTPSAPLVLEESLAYLKEGQVRIEGLVR